MDLEKYEFSTRPVNLREHILMQQGQHSDWLSIFNFIQLRSNIPADTLLDLDEEDLKEIITKINEAIATGIVLQNLARS